MCIAYEVRDGLFSCNEAAIFRMSYIWESSLRSEPLSLEAHQPWFMISKKWRAAESLVVIKR